MLNNIDITELHKNRNIRLNRRVNTYEQVLNKCYIKINQVSNKTYDTYCSYVIPEIMFGVPLYDKNECIKYIFDKLIKKGFQVNYFHPNLFYISWDVIPEKKEELKKIEMPTNQVKQISEYKPSGNFIYSNKALTSIDNINK